MLDLVKKLNENEIPYKNYPSKGKWEIQIKEVEIDSFYIKEPDYKQCTKKQLIMLLEQKNIQIQNIKFQNDNLNQSYSRLFNLYQEKFN